MNLHTTLLSLRTAVYVELQEGLPNPSQRGRKENLLYIIIMIKKYCIRYSGMKEMPLKEELLTRLSFLWYVRGRSTQLPSPPPM